MSESRTTNELARLAARQKLAVLWAVSTLITATFVTSIGVASYATVNDYRRPGPVTLSEVVAVLGLVMALLFIGGAAVLWYRRKRRFLSCVWHLREYSDAEASQIVRVPLRVLLTPAGAGRGWLLLLALAVFGFFLGLLGMFVGISWASARFAQFPLSIGLIPGCFLYLAGSFGNRWTASVVTMLRRGSRAICLTCGYPRVGLPWESPCPECGTPHSIARFHYINAFWGSPFR